MGPPPSDDGPGKIVWFALGGFCDLDPLWFKMFRRMTLQINVEQAIFKVGAGHLDIVRHLETALKTAARDALMQIRHPFPLVERLALNDKDIFLHRNIDIILARSGNCQ